MQFAAIKISELLYSTERFQWRWSPTATNVVDETTSDYTHSLNRILYTAQKAECALNICNFSPYLKVLKSSWVELYVLYTTHVTNVVKKISWKSLKYQMQRKSYDRIDAAYCRPVSDRYPVILPQQDYLTRLIISLRSYITNLWQVLYFVYSLGIKVRKKILSNMQNQQCEAGYANDGPTAAWSSNAIYPFVQLHRSWLLWSFSHSHWSPTWNAMGSIVHMFNVASYSSGSGGRLIHQLIFGLNFKLFVKPSCRWMSGETSIVCKTSFIKKN